MIQSEKLKEHARRLRLYNIANRMDSILHHCLLYTSDAADEL